MRILAVSTWFPFPPDNGAKARTYNLLRCIGERHDLDLLTLSQSERDADYLPKVEEFCRRVTMFPELQFQPIGLRSWLRFFSPTPRYFQAHHRPDMEALALRWSGKERYDAVFAISLGAAPYAGKLDLPVKVLDQHNVESQVIKRRWRNEPSLIGRLRYAPTWMKAERFERALASNFDLIAVVSENERRLMETLLRNGRGRNVRVVPNGVDPSCLDFPPVEKEAGVLVFTGALAYQPNLDAATTLCAEILPAVRRRGITGARLKITGKTDGLNVSHLIGPAVEFTGYVDDIRPVVASASALVVPLRYGGGTRLKILEAMALGTPVVSTPMGAEGLEVLDGVHVLLGETPDELAERIVWLLTDTGMAEQIAQNARELVKKRYQWPDIAVRFEKMISESAERYSRCTRIEMKQRR